MAGPSWGPAFFCLLAHRSAERKGGRVYDPQLMLFQILWMIATIGALLAVSAAAFYTLCYLTLLIVRLFPLIGKRHRHQRWAELNGGAACGAGDSDPCAPVRENRLSSSSRTERPMPSTVR